MQIATSCGGKLSTPPCSRHTTGSALDRLRCVGHSPIQQEGDTIRNATKAVSKDKMKMDKSSLKSMPNTVHIKSLKNSDIVLLSIDTRCKELRPVMPHLGTSCLSLRSTHWASYSSSELRLPSTTSQDSCATRTLGKSQRREDRQQEIEKKARIRIRRHSFKPVIDPVLFQEPKISQCAGIIPVATKENPVRFHEMKIRAPVFRQHYEVMFQEAPWRPLRSSAELRPLTVSSCRTSKPSSGTRRANLATAPSSICLEVPCSTPNTLSLQLEGLRVQGAWLPSGEDKGPDTRTSGRAHQKDLKLMAAERVSEAGDDGKWEREQTRESASSDTVSLNESAAGSTRWDPRQFKVTVTTLKKQSRT